MTREFVNVRKSLLISSLIIGILALLPAQSSFAETLTLTGLDTGNHLISFRDISVTGDLSPSMSFDKPAYNNGQSGILTVIDHNANVDTTTIETITAFSGLDPILLTETSENSGEFTGPFTASVDPITYTPATPFEVARALINIDLLDPGTVQISDVILPSDGIGCVDGVEPATHAINIATADGATLASLNSITISYANGALGGSDPATLKMYYDDGVVGYTLVTELFVPGFIPGDTSHDFDFDDDLDGILSAVTTDPIISSTSGFLGTLGKGSYLLVLNTGCAGGGAGGLVHPGLVLNVLASLTGGSGGPDNSPPSLISSSPSILGSLFAPDPFKPISPTTSP
ncbi:MAG: hypothetical protein ACRD32_01085, partial [Nitrososphaerales archaeon]